MTDDELKRWLREQFPFLASNANAERYVTLVREIEKTGKKPPIAKLMAVGRLNEEFRERIASRNAQ